MPSLTNADDVNVLVRRTMPTDGSEPRVVLVVGNDAAALTPAEAFAVAGYLSSVAGIVAGGHYRD